MQAPREVSDNPELSEIWDRVTDGGKRATATNVDLYVQLCWWYLELKTCRGFATAKSGEARVFASDDGGRLVTLPFTAEMERAQRAIERIECQLGTKASGGTDSKKASVLSLVISDRQRKAAQAQG